MNRSILIVICDFLLVSLLAFSTVDINKVSDQAVAPQMPRLEIATNQVGGQQDLAGVMRLALEDERRGKDQLLGELARTRATASEREKQAANLQQEAARLEAQRNNLEQQYASAQTNLQALSERLQVTASEAVVSREKLEAMEADLRKKAEEAAALQRQLALLSQSNQMVLTEKQRLANDLRVAEVERRAATQQAAMMQEQVKVEREEKARLSQQAEKLAEGVKTLATNSGQLATEIRESRPLASNTIFNDCVTNRVEAQFNASRPGLFGDSIKRKDTETVLVADGTNVFALCHVQDTPLTLWNPGLDWDGLTGFLGRNGAEVPIHSLSFSLHDPRLVLLPLTQAEARKLGSKVYRVSPNPFKFQDAVVVGAREGYYGECRFEIDLSTPDYLKMDHNSLKGLFGKFNPSRGDLVFSRTGELLGLMANSTYCLVLRDFDGMATFQFGKDLRDLHTGTILAGLYERVFNMPYKLQ